ncbi:MAG: phenylalanine--tRNA ligase subunit beta [Proteobacteria bacterium]|nr:phenylalanine--tRNA ligase subunit beta [Pseudomonadota bacterium]
MKFTLSWLKEHLQTDATTAQVVDAMTMAGLEVEHVEDPAAKLAAFSVAKIVEAVQHPNADRLRVCQVDTAQGRLEIVCGAPNARAGLTTVFAPIGTYIPGSGITLEPRPVRGVVSNGMLCSAAELELADDSDGILELDGALAVGTPAAQALGLEAVIDFEVTPNRPDWLGVAGIARDLAAAGLGTLKDPSVAPVKGEFPNPITIRLDGSDACPAFSGRLIRGVKNGPSPAWLQQRLKAVGLRPINALVDVTNLLSYDRARPLHVYDARKLTGGFVEARLGREGETVEALDGKSYAATPEICVIADGSGAIGLGGVMGGESTGCSDDTVDVFVESAWFDPIRTAQAGRTLTIVSDAQYRFARGVDPEFVVPGLELATRLILELCGGEPSEVTLAGELPGRRPAFDFDPAYVKKLSGLDVGEAKVWSILEALGFERSGSKVQAPSWRRDVEGKADLVEEVARIEGYGALPADPLPYLPTPAGGVLTVRQNRIRVARRALAAAGYEETICWSFTARATAQLFGGGDDRLVLSNPIAADLDCMRPSGLPGLIEAVGRNAKRGFPDCALYEIGPVFAGDEPGDQRTAVTAVLAPHAPRRWDKGPAEGLYTLKAALYALLDELGAPTANLQVAQGQASPWWHPGRSARLQLGPKAVLAEFGEIHPATLKALDVDGPVYAFELWLEAIPEPKKKAVKTKPALTLSPFMPLSRDFAFVVDRATAAGDVVRAVQSADRVLIAGVRVFDVYEGPGVPEGKKSVAVEAQIQPREKTLTDAEIEALSAKIIAAAAKSAGAALRG